MNSYHGEDLFDQLPEPLLRLIFNKLHDAQSLCRSMSVCKRFGSIIPQIDTVLLTIPRRNVPLPVKNDENNKDSDDRSTSRAGRLQRKLLKSLVNYVIVKPLQFIAQIVTRKHKCHCQDEDDEFSYRLPNEILKGFNEIRSLRIELPSQGRCYSGDIGSNSSDTLLKWKATFGSKLESCVILGATSLIHGTERQISNNNDEENDQQNSFFTDDELKLRVVWTISCLMAASARHYMLQQLVSEHRMLESAVITDTSKQGRVCMQNQQIEELRNSTMNSGVISEPELERTRVPALRMKMWYVPELELPASGCVMKGATLVVIRPADRANGAGSDGDLMEGAFDDGEVEEEEIKAFSEAVRKMKKKKTTYTLEMNCF